MPSGASRLISQVRMAAMRPLPGQAMVPVPAPRNDDIDRAYWHDPGVDAVPVNGGYRPVDDQLFITPTADERGGENPQVPVWMATNAPPWNHPSFRSIPFEDTFEICVPTYEQEYEIGSVLVGDMEMRTIKSVSYHVLSGLAQYELFEFKMYRSGQFRTAWEDMIIDPTTADPSKRYVFAGDTKPLLLEDRVDRAKQVRFTVKARGLVNLAGASNHQPGDPINPSAFFRLSVNGWIAPLRHNDDGGPRPTDLGAVAATFPEYRGW